MGTLLSGIVGALAGGVFMLALILAFGWMERRRRRNPQQTLADELRRQGQWSVAEGEQREGEGA